MNLLNNFLSNTNFSSYEDFYKNFKLNIPDNFNFAYDVVDFYAEHSPQQRALVWCNDEGSSKILTFNDISVQSKLAALFLKQQNIQKGDVVMLSLRRRYEYWIFIIALHRLGAVAFPVSLQLTKKDIDYRFKICNAKLLITETFLNEKWNPFLKENPKPPEIPRPQILENDPMLLYFTSGTEGIPKPVIHNWLYPLAHIITAKYWQKNIDGGLHYSMAETGWAKASWGKIYGQWICGSAVFVYDRKAFNPQSILQKISDFKVNTFCAPPVIYRYLVEQNFSKYDLSSLKHCCSAGEALNQNVAEIFYNKTGLTICEGYGQTETALLCANFDFNSKELPVSSLGKPSPQYDISIVDSNEKKCGINQTGEIVIKLPQKHPVGLCENCNNGKSDYFHTGDLAYCNQDGIYFFMGRKDDVIKSAGFRITPFEVETIINMHPAIEESFVYGETDSKRGQIVVASVVLKKEFEQTKKLEQEIFDFIRQNTALYKCPRRIEFVKELAKTYNGKIKRGQKTDGEKIESE